MLAEVFQEHRESDVFERAGIADTMSGLTSYLLKQYVRQETNFITKLLKQNE